MLYKKQGRPEIGDIVTCTVKRIVLHSVFVNLDEYINIEGMVHISEIAPGRIRNLRDYVIEGKRIICKVLSINMQGNIDLSLRRVPLNLSINKMNDFKQEEKAEKLLESIGKEVNMDLKKIYDEIGYKAIEKYGGLYPFLQAIVEQDKSVIDELKPNQKLSEVLFKTVKEKIKPIEVSVSGILNLKSYTGKGIEDIRSLLSKAKNYQVKISYLGAPKYKLEVISKDYKNAETSLRSFIDEITNLSKKLNCEMSFIKND